MKNVNFMYLLLLLGKDSFIWLFYNLLFLIYKIIKKYIQNLNTNKNLLLLYTCDNLLF